MTANLLCVAAMVLTVKYEAQPLKEGGFEYVVTVEPLAIESLRRGTDLRSDVPLANRDVRRIRVTASAAGTLAGDFGPSLAGPQNSAFSPGVPGGTVAPSAFSGIGTFPPDRFTLPKVELGKPNDAGASAPSLLKKTEKSAAPSPSPGDRKPEPQSKARTADSGAEKKTERQSAEPVAEERPLAPASLGLTLSLAATTIGSFSGMVFFGWVAWDYRNRYRALLRRSDLEPRYEEAESEELADLPPPDEDVG